MLIRLGLHPAKVQASPTKVQAADVDFSATLRPRNATSAGCDSERPLKNWVLVLYGSRPTRPARCFSNAALPANTFPKRDCDDAKM